MSSVLPSDKAAVDLEAGATVSREADAFGAEPRWFLGTLAIVRVPGNVVGERFSLIELVLPRHASPQLHTHPQDESYIVLDGQLTIQSGGCRYEIGAGETAVIPVGTRHTFRVNSDTARVLVLSTPAGIERFIYDASVPANSPTLPPPDAPRPAGEELARIFAEHEVLTVGPALGPSD